MEGAKHIEIVGKDDKRQITAVFSGSMSGDFLSPQLIYMYQGKTKTSLPSIEFPSDSVYTENHWSNQNTMIQYLEKILFPYIEKKHLELKLHANYPALVLFDRFKGQCTEKIFSLLKTNNILVAIFPALCIDRLQPLDVSVNKAVKDFLRCQFILKLFANSFTTIVQFLLSLLTYTWVLLNLLGPSG